MINFEWPWLFILFPLPFLIRMVLPVSSAGHDSALNFPFLQELEEMMDEPTVSLNREWLFLLAFIAWLCLVMAVMRPQWLGEVVDVPVTGRDLMLAVDLSGSMQENDFIVDGRRVDRLSATKWVAGDFIERRVGDRIGLILFGERAYLQSPLTFDRKTVRILLYESAIGLAGKSTAIGDAIGIALKRLSSNENSDKVLILLTDGANNSGVLMPEDASRLAKEAGLKIYTIGIGAESKLVSSLFGRQQVNPSRELDELTLKNIADETGGQYFRARDTDEMEKIYAVINSLEPVEQDAEKYRPRTSLYVWPLALAFILILSIALLKWRSH